MWSDEIKLNFGHNLITGDVPDLKAGAADLNAGLKDFEPIEVQSFGLFSSPDFNKFYPGIKKEELKPNSEDFVSPVFRALSEVVVHKQYNPIDFGESGVLKKSMSLLVGQSVKGDHEGGVHTSMGAVDKVEWQEAMTVKGVKVPAGINARLKIDAVANPRVARQLLMDPPGIHSTSVTLSFLWDKSHPSMPEAEFFMKLGTFDKDGKMIRRIATQIKNYREISLVDHGADPFAKMLNKDGKIIMPEHANVVYNHDKKTTPKYFSFDIKQGFEDIVYNSADNTIPPVSNDIQTSNSENMKEALIALAALVAFTDFNPEDATQITQLKEKLEKLKKDKETAEANAATLTTENATLKAGAPDAAKLTALESFKNTTLTAIKAKAIANLQKVHDNKAPQALVDAIQNMDNAPAIEALNDSYEVQLETKYPLSCKKCGSHEVNRATASNKSEEGGKDDGKEKTEALTWDQIKAAKMKNTGSTIKLHDEVKA